MDSVQQFHFTSYNWKLWYFIRTPIEKQLLVQVCTVTTCNPLLFFPGCKEHSRTWGTNWLKWLTNQQNGTQVYELVKTKYTIELAWHSYLQFSGICPHYYDTISPGNEGTLLDGMNAKGMLVCASLHCIVFNTLERSQTLMKKVRAVLASRGGGKKKKTSTHMAHE